MRWADLREDPLGRLNGGVVKRLALRRGAEGEIAGHLKTADQSFAFGGGEAFVAGEQENRDIVAGAGDEQVEAVILQVGRQPAFGGVMGLFEPVVGPLIAADGRRIML